MGKIISNNESGYIMMSRSSSIETSGSVYYYDKISGEKSDAKLIFVRIPNSFRLVERITDRNDLSDKRNDIDNEENIVCFLYSLYKDIDPEDVQTLLNSFKSEFKESFERKHTDLCISEISHIESCESVNNEFYETVIIFIVEKR